MEGGGGSINAIVCIREVSLLLMEDRKIRVTGEHVTFFYGCKCKCLSLVFNCTGSGAIWEEKKTGDIFLRKFMVVQQVHRANRQKK